MKSVAEGAGRRFESISSIIFIVDFVVCISGGFAMDGSSKTGFQNDILIEPPDWFRSNLAIINLKTHLMDPNPLK